MCAAARNESAEPWRSGWLHSRLGVEVVERLGRLGVEVGASAVFDGWEAVVPILRKRQSRGGGDVLEDGAAHVGHEPLPPWPVRAPFASSDAEPARGGRDDLRRYLECDMLCGGWLRSTAEPCGGAQSRKDISRSPSFAVLPGSGRSGASPSRSGSTTPSKGPLGSIVARGIETVGSRRPRMRRSCRGVRQSDL